MNMKRQRCFILILMLTLLMMLSKAGSASAMSNVGFRSSSDGDESIEHPLSSTETVADVESIYPTTGLRIADFLLNQQNADGVIPDAPGSDVANMDSNLEYALIGLGAAYWYSGDTRYLEGLAKGIHWLADREEMTDPRWRGSWAYAYQSTPPYSPVPISVSPEISDVRGVDATSALFVYLLYLHSNLSGSDALAKQYEEQAKAALDFILTYNQSPNGFFYSSWQKWISDGQWHLWPFQYAADQADVYLGLHAGWLLYGEKRYQEAADGLEERVNSNFFAQPLARYALGLYENDDLELDLEGFNGTFAQGYLPWVWGKSTENQAAFQWLKACEQADGSLSCYTDDPKYSLSAAIYTMSASSLGYPLPTGVLDWIISHTYDAEDGSVRDTLATDSVKFANVAGFAAIAFLRFPAFGQSSPEEIIVDNRDPHTKRCGCWCVSGGTHPRGDDSLYARNGATFTWNPELAQSGRYRVYAWWTEYSSRSTSVPYEIAHASGAETVRVNQLEHSGQWNLLGTYTFNAGSEATVTVTAEDNRLTTCADAVRFVKIY